MAHKLFDRSLILAKLESVYNTDPTPTVGSNAIKCSVPDIEYLEKTLERNVTRKTFGQNEKRAIITGCKITFQTELHASDFIDTAPRIDPLLRACGFTQVPNSGVDISYKSSDSTTQESCTIYFYQDGIFRKATGCRGTFKLSAKTNEYIMVDWEFTGFYHAASDASPSTPTFDGGLPIIFNNVTFNSTTISNNNIDAIEITVGNEITPIPACTVEAGITEYLITGRKITGSFGREAGTMSTFDPVELWRLRDTVDNLYTVQVGPSDNQLVLTLNSVYLEKPKQANRDGILWWELPFSIQRPPFDTNNELVLKLIGPTT